jgi:transposase-like protein
MKPHLACGLPNYKLSYRDVCDLMAERGVTVVHTTVLRWVQCFDTASPCGGAA